MRYRHSICLLVLLSISFYSCKKSVFLAAKPDISLVVPATIDDCLALLNNDIVMNGYGNAGYPALPEQGSDDYYVTDQQYDTYSISDQQAVVWASQIYTDTAVNDWSLPYHTIFFANEVLEVLDKLHPSPAEMADFSKAKGSAHFYRAFSNFQLVQVFAPAYDSNTAEKDYGIPLRLSADVNERIFRASVQATYDQIFRDLDTAVHFLNQYPGAYPTSPSLAAAYGLLARTSLCVYNYRQALAYSDSCLRLKQGLMDYDTLSQTAFFPFKRDNTEVIFAAAYLASGPSAIKKSFTDSLLFASYQPGDLRKQLFFKFGSCFFGKYDEKGYAFSGLATDEIFLTRAECQARIGNVAAAMTDLNTLLATRWSRGTFVPYTVTDADTALRIVLMERRKELLFRGLRWIDLRRLNKDPRTATTLYRSVGGHVYTLPPNDPRYVYAIPDIVISFNPGMPQNPR